MKKLRSYSAKPNSSIAWSVNITFKHLHQLVFVLFKHVEHQHFITLFGNNQGDHSLFLCALWFKSRPTSAPLFRLTLMNVMSQETEFKMGCCVHLSRKRRLLVWSTRELRLIQSLRSCCRKMRHRFRLPEVLICHRRRNTSVTNNKPDGTIAETKVKLKHVEVRFSLFIHFHSPHLCFHHWVVFISVKFT